MVKSNFSKPAATPEQLLQKLQDQGLVVPDRAQALAYLRGVGAYRLKGYWFHLLSPTTHRFPDGYSFTDIAQRCEFDREIRAATIEAIDRLEVAIRSVIANHLSLKHSPHWFLDSHIFKPTREWGIGQLISKIEQEVGRSGKRRFVQHYYQEHDEPYLPPSWAISECVTFGLWSRTYAILRDPNDKKAIAKRFGVDQAEVFQSWIHTLTVLRNVAAHHGQLLRIKLDVAPANYKTAHIRFSDPKSFYAAATVVQFLLLRTGLPQRWKATLTDLFARYPGICAAELGFAPDWESSPGW